MSHLLGWLTRFMSLEKVAQCAICGRKLYRFRMRYGISICHRRECQSEWEDRDL
jgi:hypothetical protein